MKGELSVVSKQKQYSSNKVPILVEGDIATDMEEVKKFLHIMILDGYKISISTLSQETLAH